MILNCGIIKKIGAISQKFLSLFVVMLSLSKHDYKFLLVSNCYIREVFRSLENKKES
jgi:hypothetical protein